ncbi:Undecaprenyl-diphosphatase [Tenacibaculum sp. 190524A02b]|uniref:phosphatase PAP2 family protein n=1 Tax=Tenacibaculum vairaonense TaxID=3137860 RepID=UPI0032B2AD10
MLENVLQKDRELLIALNNLGSESFDYFWLTITNQFTWIPLFATVLFFVFKKLGLKKGIFTLLFIVVLVAFSDQLTNFMKNTTERLRPCNTEELRGYLRQFSYKPGGYSFWSGHASLSTTFSVFIILIFYRSSKYILLLTVFPILFGYSRIYLGVHYPSDVLTGYISGILIGFIFYFLYKELYKAVFKEVYT